jgi:hypothetical protein
LTSVISYYLLPESPRWLLEKGRVGEAETVIRAAAKINGTDLGSFQLAPLVDCSEEAVPLKTILAKLLDEKNRRISLPLWGVWFSYGLAYYGVILFVPRVLSGGDGDDDDDGSPSCNFQYSDIFVNASFEGVGLIAAILSIDRAGRVKTQVAAYLITSIGAVFMGINLSRMSVLGFGMLARAGAMGASSSTWVHTPELYGTELRATAHGVCNVVARFGALLSPYLVSSDLSVATVGIALGIMSSIAAGSAACLPETQGRGLEDAGKEGETASNVSQTSNTAPTNAAPPSSSSNPIRAAYESIDVPEGHTGA